MLPVSFPTAPEPAGEVQTCGICQRRFDLADVIRFIHQRVLPGSPGSISGPPDPGRDTPPGDRTAEPLALNGRRRPSGSAPHRLATSVGDREKLQLNGLSPTPSVSSLSSREEESRKEREEEVKRRLVDAGANTTDSGESDKPKYAKVAFFALNSAEVSDNSWVNVFFFSSKYAMQY